MCNATIVYACSWFIWLTWFTLLYLHTCAYIMAECVFATRQRVTHVHWSSICSQRPSFKCKNTNDKMMRCNCGVGKPQLFKQKVDSVLMQTLYISTLLALFLCTKTKVFGMFSAKFQTFRWISFWWFERARNVRSYAVAKVLGTKPKNFTKALKCMRIEQNIMRWRVTKPTKLFLSLRCCNCLF